MTWTPDFEDPPDYAFTGWGGGRPPGDGGPPVRVRLEALKAQPGRWAKIARVRRGYASSMASAIRRGELPGGRAKATPGRFEARWALDQEDPTQGLVYVRYLGEA